MREARRGIAVVVAGAIIALAGALIERHSPTTSKEPGVFTQSPVMQNGMYTMSAEITEQAAIKMLGEKSFRANRFLGGREVVTQKPRLPTIPELTNEVEIDDRVFAICRAVTRFEQGETWWKYTLHFDESPVRFIGSPGIAIMDGGVYRLEYYYLDAITPFLLRAMPVTECGSGW